jgi:hypothetical protein
VPLTTFEKGQRKNDVMAEHLARFTAPEGIVFVGRAQEKARVVRTEKRRHPTRSAAPRSRRIHARVGQELVKASRYPETLAHPNGFLIMC